MASGWTQFLEKKVLDQIFGNQTAPGYTHLYLGCCTGGCTDAGVVTGEQTVGQNGYTRVDITNNNTMFPNCTSDGSKVTGSDITFPTCSTTTWGTISTIVFFDAASGGNALAFADLTVPKAIGVNDTLKINAGDLTLTLD